MKTSDCDLASGQWEPLNVLTAQQTLQSRMNVQSATHCVTPPPPPPSPASCLLPPALQCTNTSSFYSPPSSSPVTLLNIHSFSLYLFYLLYIFDVKILMLQILEFKGF